MGINYYSYSLSPILKAGKNGEDAIDIKVHTESLPFDNFANTINNNEEQSFTDQADGIANNAESNEVHYFPSTITIKKINWAIVLLNNIEIKKVTCYFFYNLTFNFTNLVLKYGTSSGGIASC
jgi:hypothetical protein